MQTRLYVRTSLTLLVAMLAVQPAWARGKKKAKVQPDYTKGAILEKSPDYWNIGPTGIVGYFWSRRTTTQIPVKEIETGSPAEGVVKVGDVLVGLGDGRFTNARDELINAIIEAEKVTGGGKITFNVWRPKPDGKPKEGTFLKVGVTVPFMGAYSKTSPWDCPKTEAIIKKAVQHIIDSGLGEEQIVGEKRSAIAEDLNALGLLATGDDKLLPLVRSYAHKIAGPTVIYKRGDKGTNSWYGGYRNIFLTEYYLRTKDDYVLPTIKSLAEYIALGVSGVGTWSHMMARNPYGPPGAYGAMNNCSITCSLSLVLARKCGVDSPAISKAIKMNIHFLDWFINKGSIPYGDHGPNTRGHDSNGRNSQAAVLYDLFGQKKGADYLTRMTIASYPTRDYGHTGHFFSWVWGPLGAARGGKDAAATFIQNTRYYTELERRFDGSFIYQGEDKYVGWDGTGARLLAFCLPRKALYITGKGDTTVAPIAGDDLENVMAAAPFAETKLSVGTYAPPDLSVKELIKALGSWSPIVRMQAANELGKRKENVTDQLVAMLESPNANERYGACLGFRSAGGPSKKALQLLLDYVKNSNDLTMRYYAVSALRKPRGNPLGEAVLSAGPVLLKLAGELDKKQDPYDKLNQSIVDILFSDGGYYARGKGIETLDPDHFLTAIKAFLSNPNGGARSAAVKVYDALSDKELEKLWPDVYNAANESAVSGVMFGISGKQRSVQLLAKHKFKEAIPMAVADMLQGGWGKFARVPSAFNVLSSYGSEVKPFLPFIEYEYQVYMNRGPKSEDKITEIYDALMKQIDRKVKVKSIKPYMTAAGLPYKKPDVSEILQDKARLYFGWETVGKTRLKDRTWRYTTLSPKPDKEYETLNISSGVPFKDVAAGEKLKDWFKPDFDDSGWKKGQAPIGKEPWTNEKMEWLTISARTQWDNNDTYLLMRTTVEADPARYEKYRMKLVDTIGVRIYLNGQEIFTPKYAWAKKPVYRKINDKVSGILKKGTNVLAIYAHNHNKGPVMVDCYIEGLLKKENFDPTPYFKDE